MTPGQAQYGNDRPTSARPQAEAGRGPAGLTRACVQLGNLADHLDDELRGRFGGSTVFEAHRTLVN